MLLSTTGSCDVMWSVITAAPIDALPYNNNTLLKISDCYCKDIIIRPLLIATSLQQQQLHDCTYEKILMVMLCLHSIGLTIFLSRVSGSSIYFIIPVK